MLFARPLTAPDVPVRPLWLDTVVPKFAAVDTSTLYDAAPVTVPQFIVIEVGSFTVPLDGEASTGTVDAAMIVVKLHAPDQALVPLALLAFTSQ